MIKTYFTKEAQMIHFEKYIEKIYRANIAKYARENVWKKRGYGSVEERKRDCK